MHAKQLLSRAGGYGGGGVVGREQGQEDFDWIQWIWRELHSSHRKGAISYFSLLSQSRMVIRTLLSSLWILLFIYLSGKYILYLSEPTFPNIVRVNVCHHSGRLDLFLISNEVHVLWILIKHQTYCMS